MNNIKSPWLEHYPSKVPFEIKPHHYESLVDLFEESVRKYSSLPAFVSMGTSISYNELNLLTRKFATYLQQELGLQPGARIAIQLPNILQYPIAMIGALRAGLIVVNINPLYTSREMQHQLADSGAVAIVVLANFASKLENILRSTSVRHIIITELGDQLGAFKKTMVNAVAKHIKKMVPKYHLPRAVAFNDAINRGSQLLFHPPIIEGTDIAFLQYTGGTTGISKAAVLSHSNIFANIEQFSIWIKGSLKEGEETVVTALPLYHIMALMGNCFTMMKLGAKNVLIPNPRDTKGFIKEIKKYKVSIFSGVNTLYNNLLNHSSISRVDFSDLKFCAAGGMAMQISVAEKWKKLTGVAITEGYGLTETSPILTFNPLGGKERLGTVGMPLPGTQIMIADRTGQALNIGEAGEIYAKGPQVMKRYFNQSLETAHAFSSSGWFKTGDIGRLDEDGFLTILDRKKEMIIVSGFKVYPSEIENIIAGNHKVLEVGAIGVPDERTSEAVKIFVVRKDTSLTKDELWEFCGKHLTLYKIPKHIEFIDELPKSTVGKVLRRALKEEELLEV
ncbi:long-chain-fatty-acid--CoA ligase [Marivirga lumbricoides]|uniref:Long-chain-fatty-acid--CoA ligase n=1 Tax=Marivirga lumbricoides TaxID=1046115 RepID=A0ABQ1M470_9BACT|nr:long-chain-fatty-acid--CoA ligase [Marivirga lumbricoides]